MVAPELPDCIASLHCAVVKNFLAQRWFLLAFLSVLILGIAAAPPLHSLSESAWLRRCIVATVIFVMALPLEAKAIWRSLRSPGPPLLAVFINLGLLPLVAWGVSFGLRGDLGAGV